MLYLDPFDPMQPFLCTCHIFVYSFCDIDTSFAELDVSSSITPSMYTRPTPSHSVFVSQSDHPSPQYPALSVSTLYALETPANQTVSTSSQQHNSTLHPLSPACPWLKLTLVPPHPNLNAASCANSSPNPSIKPLTNGRNMLIAAPRNMLQIVGGL